ncbi:MAG: hypothetical protein MUE44_29110 [Oscillatoriaceae cyanobacterium Prado104]|nr:hypothetical protein [Oscillatoriaceae cyanobacterium Prado104]
MTVEGRRKKEEGRRKDSPHSPIENRKLKNRKSPNIQSPIPNPQSFDS